MNPIIDEIPPSLIRAIAAKKRPGDIDLGLGEPTLRPEMAPFEAAVEWTRKNGSPYSPNAGFMELREAIAQYLRRSRESGNPASSSAEAGTTPGPRFRGDDGGADDLSAANVCVTIGSEEALYLAIKTVVDPARHEVLIVEPCYLAYAKLCMLEGIRHRMVPLSPADQFRPNAAAVLAQLRPETRLVIINTPNNPTGRVWPATELAELAAGLARHVGDPIFVLTDEVYRELYYGDDPPASIADYHPHTLIAGSLSKSNALTGLRLGWLAGPAAVITAATKVHQFVNTAASTFSQRVALEIFTGETGLSAHRPVYAFARESLIAAATRLGLELIDPEGAFYGFIRLPPPHAGDSLRFAEHLLDARRVITVPGLAFGESGEGWLRISWVGRWEIVEEGLERIAAEVAGSP